MTATPKPEAGADLAAMRALAGLDERAEQWASEVDLTATVTAIASKDDRESRIESLVKQAWIEGAYTARAEGAALSPALERREPSLEPQGEFTPITVRSYSLPLSPTPQPARAEQFAKNANCSPGDHVADAGKMVGATVKDRLEVDPATRQDRLPVQAVAGEAYQVIGQIANAGGLFEHPDVQRALDYFSGDLTGEILPFIVSPAPSEGVVERALETIRSIRGSYEADFMRNAGIALSDHDAAIYALFRCELNQIERDLTSTHMKGEG